MSNQLSSKEYGEQLSRIQTGLQDLWSISGPEAVHDFLEGQPHERLVDLIMAHTGANI